MNRFPPHPHVDPRLPTLEDEYVDVYTPPGDVPLGPIEIRASESGLTWLSFTGETRHPRRPSALTEECSRQLHAYFQGCLSAFDLPLAPRGTAFQCSVWQALREIPYGETRSYRELAAAIGRPQAVRAVGAANGRNPIAIIVPCHRVIGANGKLTGYAGGLPRKQWLLGHEGLTTLA
ncbi:methylated-DNA--[protein]-cysteine S-methyltransferase [Salinicola peritrichatus]|uniref:methylated-DNA--[protein]-cysteine S-methyltransferase n=1 Tax=Salinicola peritrichatus TaxID=1267424 RepID=UPI000DA1ECCF|nr:methylated-DNA--[protein]-cysteine S-methyltransferase [Salinicola peritrichatus]